MDPRAPPSELLVLVQVFTDVELLAPVVAELRRRGATTRVAVTKKALRRTPQIEPVLDRTLAPWSKVDEDDVVAGRAPDLESVAAVLAATESTAPAHRPAHELAKRADRLGVATFTMQHGLENVGLTYFDGEYPPGSVDFASRTIFTWGPLERLHRDVAAATRAKCVAAGCPKLAAPPAELPPRPGGRARLVAVFENLHWTRYSEPYRAAFLADLEASARASPDTTFFVRPHPAGQWLTKRFEGRAPQSDNLVIAAPDERRFARLDTAALIELADAVVTTPSTIALDAARRERPVAVTSYGLELPAYAPLPTLQSAADWAQLVGGLGDADRRARLVGLSSALVARSLVPGDAAARIADRMLCATR